MIQTDDCGLLIKQLSDRMARQANNELREDNMTFTQMRYIEYLCEQKNTPIRFKKLEAYFEVSQPTVVGVIRRLEEKGLVAVRICADDSKAKEAYLTAKGMRFHELAEGRRAHMEEFILESLNAKEKKEFKRLLKKVCSQTKQM